MDENARRRLKRRWRKVSGDAASKYRVSGGFIVDMVPLVASDAVAKFFLAEVVKPLEEKIEQDFPRFLVSVNDPTVGWHPRWLTWREAAVVLATQTQSRFVQTALDRDGGQRNLNEEENRKITALVYEIQIQKGIR